MALIAGCLIAVFGRKFNTATDVSDQTMSEVLCIIKADHESGLDRMYYKKNDRYHNPDRYLSILEKNMENSGFSKAHLFNCSDADVSRAQDQIKNAMSHTEISVVPADRRDDFYLDVKENEGVMVIVKAGATERRDLMMLNEHLDSVKANYLGVVFAI